MWPYSHFIVAGKLEKCLKPSNLGAYYLGTLAPDVVYLLSDVRREQTHIPLKEVAKFLSLYPHLKFFVLGYMVHCVSDGCLSKLGVVEGILGRFPVNLVRRRLSSQYVTVLVDCYYCETSSVRCHVMETGNEMLRDLGVDDESIVLFARQLNGFLSALTFGKEIALVQRIIAEQSWAEEYLRIPRFIHRHPVLKRMLFALSKEHIAAFDHQVASYLMSLLPLAS